MDRAATHTHARQLIGFDVETASLQQVAEEFVTLLHAVWDMCVEEERAVNVAGLAGPIDTAIEAMEHAFIDELHLLNLSEYTQAKCIRAPRSAEAPPALERQHTLAYFVLALQTLAHRLPGLEAILATMRENLRLKGIPGFVLDLEELPSPLQRLRDVSPTAPRRMLA